MIQVLAIIGEAALIFIVGVTIGQFLARLVGAIEAEINKPSETTEDTIPAHLLRRGESDLLDG